MPSRPGTWRRFAALLCARFPTIEKLQAAECELSPEEQQLARYYLDRIADLQAFFQFAQLALHAVVGSDKALDFDAITRIEIE